MQGTFREVTIYDLLQVIELGQYTGVLWLTSDENDVLHRMQEDSSWRLAFASGRILHAAPATKREERIHDYLHRLHIEIDSSQKDLSINLGHQRGSSVIESLATSPTSQHPEYLLLHSLLEEKRLNLRQSQALLRRLVEETLLDVLPLCSGTFNLKLHWQTPEGIAPLSISSHLFKLQRKLQAWKQLYPIVKHPEQRPIVTDARALRRQLTGEAFRNLTEWADGSLSIRRLARRLNRSDLTVAQAIYPYLERGLIQLRAPTSS